LMVFVMALSGCMVTKSAYVQKEEEANTLAKTVSDLDQKNKELTARNDKLQAESGDLNKQLAAKDDLLQKKSEEIARQDAKQAAMVNEVERMKAQQAKSGVADIKESPAAGKSAGLKSIRMKVLSGEGKTRLCQTDGQAPDGHGLQGGERGDGRKRRLPGQHDLLHREVQEGGEDACVQAWQEYHRETPHLEIRLQHHRRDGGMSQRQGRGCRV
jgi:hypothetical protein